MKNGSPETKPTIYGPAPPESGCFKFGLECLVQLTVCIASAVTLLIKGPLGWLLAALAILASMGIGGAMIWLRDQTRW